jgi:hypothetical protein
MNASIPSFPLHFTPQRQRAARVEYCERLATTTDGTVDDHRDTANTRRLRALERTFYHFDNYSDTTEVMAQPNFQNISDALVTAGREFALMPNVPVINIGGQLLQIQQTLQQCCSNFHSAATAAGISASAAAYLTLCLLLNF